MGALNRPTKGNVPLAATSFPERDIRQYDIEVGVWDHFADEKGFRRLKAHKQLPTLRAALKAHQIKNSNSVLARQAIAA